MLCFPSMLVNAAEEADLPVPPDPENFKPERWPHFALFCSVQLNRPMMNPGEHFDNAKVIAKFRVSQLEKLTWKDLIKAGLKI